MIKINKKYILLFIIILLVEVLIALYVHDTIIRPYIGDVLVVILIYCFLRIFIQTNPFFPATVFLLAAIVEFAQMFNFVTLFGLENNRILSVALGSTFDPADLFCYAAGAILVFIWQRAFTKKF